MTETLVTILVPCRDPHPRFFQEALNSVYAQTSAFWELIIIDDSCEDQSILNMLSELEDSDDRRTRVIRNESRQITGALNTGMRQAQTTFVCTLHCDDLLDETAIEMLTLYIKENPRVDYFHSSRVFIDEHGEIISSIYQAKKSFILEDFKHIGPVKPLHCWRVDLALKIGGMDESLGVHGADDYDFVWCMAEAGAVFQDMPECLYYIRDHRKHYRLTTHVPLETQIDELKKIWRKHRMTEEEIATEIEKRSSGYLQQALFLNEAEKIAKEKDNFDIGKGWRINYK